MMTNGRVMKRLTKIFQVLLGVAALICAILIAVGRLAWRTIRNWQKSHRRLFRRSMVTVFIAILVCFVLFVAYGMYHENYGRYRWDDEVITHNLMTHSFNDGKCRVYNVHTGKYTTDRINWVSDGFGDDTLAVYALPQRRGYININNGEIVIDAATNNYTKAWVFSEGLAAVMKDGKIGFINNKNEIVIPFQFDCAESYDLYNTGFLFKEGYCAMTNAEGKVGLIDTLGNWVVKPVYDEICAPEERGSRVVYNGKKYGLLDKSLNLVYDTVYDEVDNKFVRDGYILKKDGRMWQEDYEGNVIYPFMYESMNLLYYTVGYANQECSEYQYELSSYAVYNIDNTRCGIMNRTTGKPITPAIYTSVTMISPTVFEVTPTDNYGCYLLDVNGNIIE